MTFGSMTRCLGGLLAVAMLIVFLNGCGTVQGVGRDIQSAGEALEDTAVKASN